MFVSILPNQNDVNPVIKPRLYNSTDGSKTFEKGFKLSDFFDSVIVCLPTHHTHVSILGAIECLILLSKIRLCFQQILTAE